VALAGPQVDAVIGLTCNIGVTAFPSSIAFGEKSFLPGLAGRLKSEPPLYVLT